MKIDMRDIESIFYPRSIAIIGASSSPASMARRLFLQPLLKYGYQGNIYPVNPKEYEIAGFKAYANIRDIPEPVDYVICSIPAPLTPQIIQDCVEARVKTVALFTAGFSETGEEDGLRLEKEIVEIAHRGGVSIIGPNCLGIYSPKLGVAFNTSSPKESGPVGFLSQSGGNARELILMGIARGICFSKIVSYGNASDLNESDFLEYFAHDADTEIIAAYIEGIKQPQRFLKALREATGRKPVIILKGGNTEAGIGAVASHTGMLAGSKEIWDALCRQEGIIQTYDLEEIADIILAFLYLKPPRGRRIGIIGVGGGFGVQAADDCENAGLIVPPFPKEIRQELGEFTPLAGSGLRNPVDSLSNVYWDPALFSVTVDIVANYDGVDLLFVLLSSLYATVDGGVQLLMDQIEASIEVGKRIDKPMVVILPRANTIEAEKINYQVQEKYLKAGFATYPSSGRAAQAISRFISHHENRVSKSSTLS